MSEPVPVTVLGATGSIGAQALDVISASPDRFRVVGLAVGSDAETLISQARVHRPDLVAVADPLAAAEVRKALPDAEVLDGPRAASRLAAYHEAGHVVLNGIDGSRGLQPTLAALNAGNRVALANKESLIVGGELVLEAARDPAPPDQAAPAEVRPAAGAGGVLRADRLVPVDSEHSALAQCLRAGASRELSRLVVTASGGPFRGWSQAELERVTVADALAHPTWDMGSVITVNSASLANKGLEVIEAHLLFAIPYEAIDVVVHPQSVVHGMVEFLDGATMAKLSPPDMRLPIQLALTWPERLDHAPARMDWSEPVTLEFEPVDTDAFPMLDLAVDAGRRAATYPGVYNAANEEAVAAFLGGRLDFLGIPRVVEAVLAEHDPQHPGDLETVLGAEEWARARARELVS